MWKKRLVSGSFWLIMAIHLVVFASIGIFTDRGWRLLIIFICGLVITMLIWSLVKVCARRYPDKKWSRKLIAKHKK